jgi:L-galactono-1,4-lactone dehydrogenase
MLSTTTSVGIGSRSATPGTAGAQQTHVPLATAAAAAVLIGALSLTSNGVFGYNQEYRTAATTTRLEEADEEEDSRPSDATTTLLNWSGTHGVEVDNRNYYEPDSVAEVEAIVAHCHERGQAIRPLGSALSPNAIGLNHEGMMSLANLDAIVDVDREAHTITVQAGARVSQVVEALRPLGLTLPNLASIAEQQMGGFVQVGAHGTGMAIAPVDHYVTSLKVVTPGRGTMTLTPADGDIFHLAKVGLGCLGVVVEVTMECIPAHRLVEHTFVLTRHEAVAQVDTLLRDYKHIRYMWIPYTDAVVVVTNHPADEVKKVPKSKPLPEAKRFAPLRELLKETTQDAEEPFSDESMQGMGFGELRDALLAINPLNIDHVKRCNAAEAEFWRLSSGYQVRPSDELLQFDCGGQQWVWEICFPTGTQEKNTGNDMELMRQLLEGIEEKEIPAHSPIEQRWSSGSSSFMSPAHGTENDVFTWVGIINYLPLDNDRQRREITDLFKGPYCDLMRSIGLPFGIVSHWAKLERPTSLWKLVDLQVALQDRYPLDAYNRLRSIFDPKNILASDFINTVLGDPRKK